MAAIPDDCRAPSAARDCIFPDAESLHRGDLLFRLGEGRVPPAGIDVPGFFPGEAALPCSASSYTNVLLA